MDFFKINRVFCFILVFIAPAFACLPTENLSIHQPQVHEVELGQAGDKKDENKKRIILQDVAKVGAGAIGAGILLAGGLFLGSRCFAKADAGQGIKRGAEVQIAQVAAQDTTSQTETQVAQVVPDRGSIGFTAGVFNVETLIRKFESNNIKFVCAKLKNKQDLESLIDTIFLTNFVVFTIEPSSNPSGEEVVRIKELIDFLLSPEILGKIKSFRCAVTVLLAFKSDSDLKLCDGSHICDYIENRHEKIEISRGYEFINQHDIDDKKDSKIKGYTREDLLFMIGSPVRTNV